MIIKTKKIKKQFSKQFSINKKKHFHLNEKNINEDVFFTKEVDINNLVIKIFVKNEKYKKNIIFKFLENGKEIKFSRKQTNDILVEIFNNPKKNKMFLTLLKNLNDNKEILKIRLKEIYKDIPKDIQIWIDEKEWKNNFDFDISLNEKIEVLLIKESAKNLLADFSFEDKIYDYYFDVNNEENILKYKKSMVGNNKCFIDLNKLHIKLCKYEDDNDLVFSSIKYFYEKNGEEITLTKELNDIIFDKIFEIKKEEWENYFLKTDTF